MTLKDNKDFWHGQEAVKNGLRLADFQPHQLNERFLAGYNTQSFRRDNPNYWPRRAARK